MYFDIHHCQLQRKYDFYFPHYLPSTPGWQNNVLPVSVHMVRHNNLSINCTFLSSFQGVLYLEIWLSNMHSTFASLEFSTVSQQRASAGESVLISNITLKSSTVYFYNVSAVLEDESTPAVVVQGIITTPSTTKPSTTKPSTNEIHRSKLTLTMSKTLHSFKDKNYTPCGRKKGIIVVNVEKSHRNTFIFLLF